MRGHEALIEMRLGGVAPKAVFFDADGGWPAWWFREWPKYTPEYAHLQLDPNDNLQRLDLRCVVGLLVHVLGSGERQKRLRDAVIRAGASRVICVTEDGVIDTGADDGADDR
jgi:hypothetical protein